MADETTAIHVRGLSKVFGGRTVFSHVDLDVAEGESVALTGANGSGKTTLLRCLASVLRPGTGEVRWFGQPANANPAARRLIGMVAHESSLYPHLTLRENLLFAARMCDVRRPADRADRLLQDIGLQGHAHRVPTRISKGMRQRLAIARSLVHDPRILLLDEPFSGLDDEGTDWLMGLLADLRNRQRTVCFATHDRRKAHRLADRIVHLQSGRIEQFDTDSTVLLMEDTLAARAA